MAWIGEIVDPADGSALLDHLREEPVRGSHGQAAADYLTTAEKWCLLPVAKRSGQRVRPIRLSARWPGGSLAAAEKLLIDLWHAGREKDPGPFEMWHERDLHQQPAIRAQYGQAPIVLIGWPA